MALLFLDGVGSNAEQLALEAGRATEIPVGYDAEVQCATFDSDSLGEEELQTVVFEALATLDSDWRTHLNPSE